MGTSPLWAIPFVLSVLYAIGLLFASTEDSAATKAAPGSAAGATHAAARSTAPESPQDVASRSLAASPDQQSGTSKLDVHLANVERSFRSIEMKAKRNQAELQASRKKEQDRRALFGKDAAAVVLKRSWDAPASPVSAPPQSLSRTAGPVAAKSAEHVVGADSAIARRLRESDKKVASTPPKAPMSETSPAAAKSPEQEVANNTAEPLRPCENERQVAWARLQAPKGEVSPVATQPAKPEERVVEHTAFTPSRVRKDRKSRRATTTKVFRGERRPLPARVAKCRPRKAPMSRRKVKTNKVHGMKRRSAHIRKEIELQERREALHRLEVQILCEKISSLSISEVEEDVVVADAPTIAIPAQTNATISRNNDMELDQDIQSQTINPVQEHSLAGNAMEGVIHTSLPKSPTGHLSTSANASNSELTGILKSLHAPTASILAASAPATGQQTSDGPKRNGKQTFSMLPPTSQTAVHTINNRMAEPIAVMQIEYTGKSTAVPSSDEAPNAANQQPSFGTTSTLSNANPVNTFPSPSTPLATGPKAQTLNNGGWTSTSIIRPKANSDRPHHRKAPTPEEESKPLFPDDIPSTILTEVAKALSNIPTQLAPTTTGASTPLPAVSAANGTTSSTNAPAAQDAANNTAPGRSTAAAQESTDHTNNNRTTPSNTNRPEPSTATDVFGISPQLGRLGQAGNTNSNRNAVENAAATPQQTPRIGPVTNSSASQSNPTNNTPVLPQQPSTTSGASTSNAQNTSAGSPAQPAITNNSTPKGTSTLDASSPSNRVVQAPTTPDGPPRSQWSPSPVMMTGAARASNNTGVTNRTPYNKLSPRTDPNWPARFHPSTPSSLRNSVLQDGMAARHSFPTSISKAAQYLLQDPSSKDDARSGNLLAGSGRARDSASPTSNQKSLQERAAALRDGLSGYLSKEEATNVVRDWMSAAIKTIGVIDMATKVREEKRSKGGGVQDTSSQRTWKDGQKTSQWANIFNNQQTMQEVRDLGTGAMKVAAGLSKMQDQGVHVVYELASDAGIMAEERRQILEEKLFEGEEMQTRLKFTDGIFKSAVKAVRQMYQFVDAAQKKAQEEGYLYLEKG